MKTEKEVKKEIDDLIDRGCNLKDMRDKEEIKERRKIRARIKYLKPILIYLEGSPAKEFVASELDKTQNKLSAINSRFSPPDNASNSAISTLRKSFDSEWGVGKIKTHIKNLKFILKK